ncbi:MAG: hypothetical protein COZ06_29715 [Armatimonadetes bacterium CG_4_10_14_3_um_filter_66_18]|nr:MAG: hypothetical protein COS65_07195 [Armatimonadetes bacterium CG06_land_8_20_14_3_00_66_21]PIY39362.1 MAG: hypothetical protein COZ06_29715 [Armatimonadetes bacterium CG_4_10_14_3_um_filter_66_18]PIZ49200.1 MAG: hypothetical protein COY42_04545 [Armatimonadetes bacterium CG_4_10_14_0_8_um_filter_66_14]
MDPLEHLQTIRRRLSEESGGDLSRYADMLREASLRCPGRHVDRPPRPQRMLQSRPEPTTPEPTEKSRLPEVAVAA